MYTLLKLGLSLNYFNRPVRLIIAFGCWKDRFLEFVVAFLKLLSLY